jgi:transposase
MGQMKRDAIKRKVVMEYLSGGRSYRELEAEYGIASSTLQRWVAASGGERVEEIIRDGIRRKEEERSMAGAEAEVKRLRKELEEARLKNELLNAMIEIAEEEFEIPIRKKSGAKR